MIFESQDTNTRGNMCISPGIHVCDSSNPARGGEATRLGIGHYTNQHFFGWPKVQRYSMGLLSWFYHFKALLI